MDVVYSLWDMSVSMLVRFVCDMVDTADSVMFLRAYGRDWSSILWCLGTTSPSERWPRVGRFADPKTRKM